MAKLVEFERSDDPRDVIHQAVQALAEGGLVAFPTDSLYVVAANPWKAPAVERLRLLAAPGGVAYLALKSPLEALDYAPEIGDLGRKLIQRCWPGPLVLVFDSPGADGLTPKLPHDVQRLISAPGQVAARAIPPGVLTEVLKLCPAPLVVAPEQADWKSASDVAAAAGDRIDLIVDQGPCRFGQAASVVRVTGDHWTLLQEGVVTERTIRRMAGTMFLFVCTGNTCRSPMAEALFRRLLSERLHCAEEDLVDRGYIVQSAGLAAGDGYPASPESVQTLHERGIDLQGHSSQAVSPRLLQQADHIFTMTRQHREMILREFPELQSNVELLARDGSDVLDPIGFGIEEYEKCAAQIEDNLRLILDRALPDSPR